MVVWTKMLATKLEVWDALVTVGRSYISHQSKFEGMKLQNTRDGSVLLGKNSINEKGQSTRRSYRP